MTTQRALLKRATLAFSRPETGTARTGLVRTLDQIMAHYDENLAFPEELIQSYALLAEEQTRDTQSAPVAYLRARNLMAESRFCEALLAMERALTTEPFNLEMQRRRLQLVRQIAAQIDEIGRARPQQAEFGRTYEHLLKLGHVHFSSHLYAVHHYYLSGNHRRAGEIARQFFKVAPNYPGLRELMHALADAGEGEDLASLGGEVKFEAHGDRLVKRPALKEVARLFRYLEAIGRYMDEKQWEAGLDLIEQTLADNPESFEEHLLDFYYYKGICLENLGRTNEAFEIFWKLKELHPEHLFYARSFRIVCVSLQQKAWEVRAQDEDSKALLHYDRILFENYYSPLWLTETAVRLGDDLTKGKERLRPLLELSPYDLDYWKACERHAWAVQDHVWIRELEEHFEKIRRARPFDPEIFGHQVRRE